MGATVPADGVYQTGGEVAGDKGKANLTFVPPTAGTYTINVRTTASQLAAAPITFVVGEAEITWADGVSASSPINGSDTYTGTLALTNPAKTPLVGRPVTIELGAGGDANFPAQTPPTARADGDSDGYLNFRRRRQVLRGADRPGTARRYASDAHAHRQAPR